MSYLAQAKKASDSLVSPMITVIGTAGTGKSSYAGTFPNPIFIQAETASTVFENWDSDIQPTLLPEIPRAAKDEMGNMKISPFQIIKEQITELATVEHPFQTLVIDSITALNRKFEQELVTKYGVASVADAAGGFHKGYLELMDMHSNLIYWCERLRQVKGMAIVFLGHSGIQKVKMSPDEGSEYSVYTLDMHKDSAAQYINNSDAVLYIQKEQFISGGETDKKGRTTKFGRVMQTGNRTLITTGDGKQGFIHAKCRYAGVPAELDLPLGENPMLQHIIFFKQGE